MKQMTRQRINRSHEYSGTVSKREPFQDPIFSSNGYIVDSSEMKEKIRQIEKELYETKEILYGDQRSTKYA